VDIQTAATLHDRFNRTSLLRSAGRRSAAPSTTLPYVLPLRGATRRGTAAGAGRSARRASVHRRLLRPRRASGAPHRAAWQIDPRLCQWLAPPEFHAPGCGFHRM